MNSFSHDFDLKKRRISDKLYVNYIYLIIRNGKKSTSEEKDKKISNEATGFCLLYNIVKLRRQRVSLYIIV